MTVEDVQRAYEKYIKDKPAVFLSMVPQDQPNLVLSNSTQADVKEEEIVPELKTLV